MTGFPEPPRSLAEKVAWAGWAFFILILLSAYTANLAAFLTQEVWRST